LPEPQRQQQWKNKRKVVAFCEIRVEI